MAIALTSVNVNSITSGDSVSTSSTVDPAANELWLVFLVMRTTSITPSVSGTGLSWTSVTTLTNAQTQFETFLWRGLSTSDPASGTITATITGNLKPAILIVVKATGIDTSGTNGSGAVENSATNAGPPTTDDDDMLCSIATSSSNAVVVGFGSSRAGTFSVPGDESSLTINNTAGTGGDATSAHVWYQDVASPSTVDIGAANDLNSARDWAVIAVSLKPSSSNQTITPSGLTGAEALGTTKVNETVSPGGVATGAAHGNQQINLRVLETITASAAAYGTQQINLRLLLTGLASGEVHGSTKVNQQIAPNGIPSGEAAGSHAVSVGSATILPSGITSAQAMGSHTLTVSSATVVANGIATSVACGSAVVTAQYTAMPSGIASGETHGNTQANLRLTAAGLATDEALGTTVVTPQPVTVAPDGIAGGEVLGDVQLSLDADYIIATAIDGAEEIGAPQVNQQVLPVGIASNEAHGNNNKLNLQLIMAGAATGEGHGTPALSLIKALGAPGIPSAQAVGSHTLTVGVVTVVTNAIVDGATVGAARVQWAIQPTSIASTEAHGVSIWNLRLPLSGIASDATWGTLLITIYIKPSETVTVDLFGTPLALRGAVALQPGGMASGAAISGVTILTQRNVTLQGFVNVTVSGEGTVTAGAVTISVTGMTSHENVGAHRFKIIIAASATASGELHGAPGLATPIYAIGANSAVSFGVVAFNVSSVTVAPTGMNSAEDYGDGSVNFGPQYMAINAIASAEAHSTPTIYFGITAASIDSTVIFGTSLWSIVVSPVSLASSEVPGDTVLAMSVHTSSLASGEVHGATVLAAAVNVIANALVSSEAHGVTTIQPGVFTVLVDDIDSGEVLGSAALAMSIQASGVTGGEAYGVTTLVATVNVLVEEIESAVAYGAIVLTGSVTVLPIGASSTEGTGAVAFVAVIQASGVIGGEAYGVTVLAAAVNVIASALASSEAHSVTIVQPGVFAVLVDDTDSGEVLGGAALAMSIQASGFTGGETHGAVGMSVRLYTVAMGSSEGYATPLIVLVVVADGIATIASVNATNVALAVHPVGVSSNETSGNAALVPVISAVSFGEESVGELSVLPQPIWILPDGITTGSGVGTTRAVWAIRPGGISAGVVPSGVLVYVFLAGMRAWRIAHEQRTWDVPDEVREFFVEQ